MNVFFRELNSYRRSTMIWIFSLSAIAIVFLMMFPAFSNDTEIAKQALSAIPAVIRDAVGLSLTTFFTIFGFFGYILTFVMLAGAVQAMNLGVNIISKEESFKTADFLFSKPISRVKVLTSKILASISLLIITNVVFCTVATVMAILNSKVSFDIGKFLLVCMTLGLVQLIFLTVGFAFAVIIPKIKSAISVTLPVVFSVFIIGSLGAIIGEDLARYLSPFKYFSAQFIVKNSYYELKYLVISGIIVGVMLIFSYFVYLKKDIQSGM